RDEGPGFDPDKVPDPTNLTPAGDQYSLGCVLYFCLTGSCPFPDGSAAEKMMAHQMKQPVPVRERNPEVLEPLAAVVERLMQKTPESRFASAGEVVEALRPLAMAPGFISLSRSKAAGQRAAQAEAARAVPQAEVARAVPQSDAAHAVPTPPPSLTSLNDTPVPPPRAAGELSSRTSANARALPTRQSLQQPAAPRPPAPPAAARQAPSFPAAAPKVEAPKPVPVAAAVVPSRFTPETPSSSLEERIGPLGIAAGAILACVLAWLLTWKLF
ncbi:MAG: hypothetical protein L0Z62_23685, partial [Gemmataceae bacterium]|nr:hypothetical protein [Gemmataceae bacterium]